MTNPTQDDYWPIEIPIHVTWGDMDALGHVNNTRFIGWFEETRFEAFKRIGGGQIGPHAIRGPILAKVECIFRAPVVFPHADNISIYPRRGAAAAEWLGLLADARRAWLHLLRRRRAALWPAAGPAP